MQVFLIVQENANYHQPETWVTATEEAALRKTTELIDWQMQNLLIPEDASDRPESGKPLLDWFQQYCEPMGGDGVHIDVKTVSN